MKSFKLLFLLLILLISQLTINAQNKKVKKADDAFNSGEYFRANEMYLQIYSKLTERKQKAEISFKIGECNRHLNLPKQAEKWYGRAVNQKNQNPLAVLYYADAMRMNEKYDEALVQYQKYVDLVPDDSRGATGVESCKLSINWIKKPSRYLVTNIKDINSKQSDFCPSFGGNNSTIYFTSTREGSTGNKFNDASGQNMSDIFVTRLDKKGKWSVPVPVEGGVNSINDEGAACLSKDGNTMYFTRCIVAKNQNLGCQICVSDKIEGNKWGDPQVITIFKDSTITVGHPTISPDGLTLYFVSDMKGGKGGNDIWKIERANIKGIWGKPVNLDAPINTPGDDSYPYVREDGVLFFSSNGHVGMGGLDIYKVIKDKEGKIRIENMKSPINSSADDFGIIFDGVEERGYFSSNRPDGKGADDIYNFEIQPLVFNLKGTVKDEEKGFPIPDAEVRLVGSDGLALNTVSAADGSFKFALKPNVDYFITTKKPRYLLGKGKESTKGLDESKTLEVVITMQSTGIVFQVDNIEYDYMKADLRQESMVALDDLYDKLMDNPTIVIELGSNTDNRGADDFNNDLSQRRAQSVVDYLIKKGIKPERLVAKGYGKTQPLVVSKKNAEKYPFLKEGDILDANYIDHLQNEQQREICHQLNRRTQFKVISTEYKDGGIPFGKDEKK